MRNKRYIFWFWLLNLTLAEFATAGFRKAAHAILDHSLIAERLTHGFDLGVLIAMLMRPEFPPTDSLSTPGLYFGFLFFLATAVFLPGVFLGYSSTYRLPRDEFFRACGRNLWRYIRIMIIAGIVMGIVAGLLFAANGAIVKKAGESTSELLPVELQFIGLAVIFLVMTTLRIWFDLAEADAVLNDQRAVRKSIAAGFRHTFRSLGRLLGSYVVAAIVAVIISAGRCVGLGESGVARECCGRILHEPDHAASAADPALLAAGDCGFLLATAHAGSGGRDATGRAAAGADPESRTCAGYARPGNRDLSHSQKERGSSAGWRRHNTTIVIP